jgi:hypothetical protein
MNSRTANQIIVTNSGGRQLPMRTRWAARFSVLQQLIADRRALTDARTALTNRLTDLLKRYFPQSLELSGEDLWRPLLNRWAIPPLSDKRRLLACITFPPPLALREQVIGQRAHLDGSSAGQPFQNRSDDGHSRVSCGRAGVM